MPTKAPPKPPRVQCPHCTYSAEPGASLAGHLSMKHPEIPRGNTARFDPLAPEDGGECVGSNHHPGCQHFPAAPAVPSPSAAGAAAIVDLPLELVRIGDNVRVDVQGLEELAASIAEHGVLQPVKATGPHADGTYLVLWGQRRTEASRLAGRATVPAILLPPDADVDAHGAARSVEQLVENLHRADLNPIDRARAMRAVVDAGTSQADLARKLGISPATVSNDLRLLETDDRVQELLASGELTTAHAKAIAGVAVDRQADLARKSIEYSWNAKELERQVRYAKESEGRAIADREKAREIAAAAISALEKVANRDTAKIGVLSYGNQQVKALVAEDGWAVVDGWGMSAADQAGACGCKGLWRVVVEYNDRAPKVVPGCESEEHQAARRAAQDAEWQAKRSREQRERDAAAEKARRRAELLADRVAGDLATPFGLRLVLAAVVSDTDEDDFIDRAAGADREALVDLDDPVWSVIERIPDAELPQYLARAAADILLTSWRQAGPDLTRAIDAYLGIEAAA